MINLILAILCSSSVSILIALSKKNVKNKIMMFLTNYVVCLICSSFFVEKESFNYDLTFTLIFGAITGVIYIASFLMLEFNIRKNGVVLSGTFSKLGVLVPIFLSIFMFKEMPSILKIIGIVLSIGAILLMNLKFEKTAGDNHFKMTSLLLIGLLLVNGFADASSTIFTHLGNNNQNGLFLMCIFLSALICAIILYLIKREEVSKYDFIFGIVIGVFNYFSSFFLLNSLSSVPSIIAYPTFSVATTIIISLFGMLFFKEKLSLKEKIGVCIIAVSIVFLNI